MLLEKVELAISQVERMPNIPGGPSAIALATEYIENFYILLYAVYIQQQQQQRTERKSLKTTKRIINRSRNM